MSVAAFADEVEREKARQRTRDAMVRKAQALHVTGGKVYGYSTRRCWGRTARVSTLSASSTLSRPPWWSASSNSAPMAQGSPASPRR